MVSGSAHRTFFLSSLSLHRSTVTRTTYPSTVKIEAVDTSETLEPLYHTTRGYVPEYCNSVTGKVQSAWRRSSSPVRVKNFLFSTSSRPALGPTQPPIQWVPWALSPGVKLTTLLQLLPQSTKHVSVHPLPQYVFMT
jgi:hypothetical protein